jgi:predicted homoserine dehydrogenase-like protein
VSEVFQLFDFEALWKRNGPVVDYVLGAEPGGGVFVIGHCDDEYQKSMLHYYKMGEGPFYLFYRPYHLCHIEAMACVAEAFLNGKSLLQPEHGFRTNVYAYAKCDLRKGERLDGIGGYTCYGLIEDCTQNKGRPGLPICLAENITLVRDVSRDEKILMSDVQYNSHRLDFELYAKAVQCSVSERS